MQPQGARKRDGFTPTPPLPMDPPPSAAAAHHSFPNAKNLISVGELKRDSLRDSLRRIHDRASSILLFSLQWKDLEDHYAAAEASLKLRAQELEALEASVVRKLKEAGRWARMLGDRAEAKIRVLEDKVVGLAARERGLGREVEERLREVEEVERKVRMEGAAVCEEMARRGVELEGLFERVRVKEEMLRRRDVDLDCREKIIEDVERALEETLRQIGSKEKKLDEALKLVVSREKEIEEREMESEVRGREIEEKMAEVILREKAACEREKWAEVKGAESEGKLRELSSKTKEVDEKLDRVRLIEEELARRATEMTLIDEEIQKKLMVIGLKEKMFEDWVKEIESKKKDNEERLKEVLLKEKRLSEHNKRIDLLNEEANKNYELKMTELKQIEKSLEEKAKHIEEKEREANKVIAQADLKKKILEEPRKGIEESSKILEPSLEGKRLQIFMIKNREIDGSFQHNVLEIIKASLNPARLVLGTLQAFYPSCNRRDNLEAKCNIFRKENCLVLLEALRNLSPEIGQTEKEEALKFSRFWNRTMKGDAEIVNFFNLLAAYKLASFYLVDGLLKSVGRVRYSRKMPELCRVLGFTDKIPGLIRDLMKFNNLPSAIRYINAFKLNGVFPVEPLINKCISNSEDTSNSKSNSISAQKKARKRRLAEMNALMECIEEFRISSKHTERIREIISSLGHYPNLGSGVNRVDKTCRSEKLTASSPATAPRNVNYGADTTSEVPPNCHLNKHPKGATPAEAGQSIITAANSMHHLSEHQARIGQEVKNESKKNGSIEPSGKVDRRSLKIIFSGEVDCDKACEKAYKLLHASPDPARLVIDALKDNASSNMNGVGDFKLGMPLKACIQLLELLRKVSPMISPRLHQDAKDFAMTWKANLKARADDYVGIVCFLLFLSAFKLSPAFNAEEIVGLLDPASWRKHVLRTFEILGLNNAIPDLIQRLVEKNNWLHAFKYAHTFGMEDKFPLEPLLKDYMAHWEKKGADLCAAHPGSPLVQMNAIEKILTATRVVIKCINFYKLESRCLMEDFEARLRHLEKQKADMALKLKDANIEHSDGSNSPESEQETAEEPTVTGNSPRCSQDDAPISANVPTTAKAANQSTLMKTAAVPGNSSAASSNVDAAQVSKDAKSGCAMKMGGKRPRASGPPDQQPHEAKRQAQDHHPCWVQNANPGGYMNPGWTNCGPPPLPPYPQAHHHPYQMGHHPHMVAGRMAEVPMHKGWPAPYPDPRNPYDGPPPPHHW
ncbi:hypothetical protein MLD38_020656 [Melastoma candidum]|uniref:Uncharacterized protein n=1 Tax=Melastoma candidum TaxID=119954 RepID=A0ACB9QLP6_9MYRT|nr:hypothetical protein MLD38_020656 [Melastoma candidum]